MGRVTRDSMRVRLQEAMERLGKKYREALKDDEMQEAFDELWPAWAEEQGAMIYAEIFSALDFSSRRQWITGGRSRGSERKTGRRDSSSRSSLK